MIERAAPIDEYSRLPLPVSVEQSTIPLPTKGPEALVNRHHAHFPARALKHGPGLEAVRQIRLQRLPLVLHSAYHHNFEGPPLPSTDQECFQAAVFSTAGYIPPQGVAFDTYDDWRTVELPEEERQQLWQSGSIYCGTNEPIRNFMMSYVAGFGGADINISMVEELLYGVDQERGAEIGRLLLRECSQAAAEPFSEQYAHARKQRLMPLARSRQAGNFVCNLLMLRPYGYVSMSAIREFGALLVGRQTCSTGVTIV